MFSSRSLSHFNFVETDKTFSLKQLFDELVCELAKCLEYLQVSPNNVLCTLENHGQGIAKECSGVTDISDLFLRLSINNHVSFLNIRLVEAITHKHADEICQEKLKKYRDKMQKYCEKRVVDLQPDFLNQPCSTYSVCEVEKVKRKQVVFKIDQEYDEYCLQDAVVLRKNIADILKVNESFLHLVKIEEGCVCLTFEVPVEVGNTLLSALTESQKRELSKQAITLITYDGDQTIFDAKSKKQVDIPVACGGCK